MVGKGDGRKVCQGHAMVVFMMFSCGDLPYFPLAAPATIPTPPVRVTLTAHLYLPVGCNLVLHFNWASRVMTADGVYLKGTVQHVLRYTSGLIRNVSQAGVGRGRGGGIVCVRSVCSR